MRRFILSLISVVFIYSGSVFANGLSLNSVGTKAFGMGGAFVGLANDATAIYWNPAGLAGQSNQIFAYYTGIMPIATYKYDLATVDAEMTSNLYSTGGLFAVYGLDKVTFGLGVYVPAGLGAEWDGADLVPFSAPLSGATEYKWLSEIGAVTIAPSIAYQFNDNFSIGLSINIYYAMFDLSRFQAFDLNADGIPETPTQYTEESTGLGYGVTLGLKYDVNDKLSIGASFRTETTVSMEGTAELPGLPATINESDFERDVSWPMWISGGIAYKVNKKLTIVADVQYSNWAALDELVAEYDALPQDGVFTLDWEDAIQYRIGTEFMVSKETALRLGYYYDPAPSPDETLNFLFPSSENNVITFGVGHDFGNFRLDAAGEYLLGAERDVDAYPNALAPENAPGKHQMDIFAFSIGVGFEL